MVGAVIGIIIAAIVVLLILVVIVRTLMFTPKGEIAVNNEEENFDKDKVVTNLQTLVKCKTVSYEDDSKEDDKEFRKLLDLLPTLYPNVFKTCSYQELEHRGILFKWTGKHHEKANVMMAHYDVVPVNEKHWSKPPFDGIIEDGTLWGRGTIDTKATFNGVLSAADHLISQGFVPEDDMYFAFSGGEEINGLGAPTIVKWFKDHNVNIYMVVDEGGAVVEGVFPGVKSSCGMIGIAEKGLLNVEYTVKSNGGHASQPKPHTPVGELSQVCCNIENHPFKFRRGEATNGMYDTLGRYSSFAMRMIFANMWLFAPVLNMICKKQGGALNALMRTTVAFTQMKGSAAPNVIPAEAKMVSNIRIHPEESVESVLADLRKKAKNDNVEIKKLYGDDPSPISEVDCEQYHRVAKAVASTWKGSIPTPYLMVQCSDSRHYGEVSNHVYRFSAQHMTKEEMGLIHGNNERITLEQIQKAVEFYIRLMKQC